MRAGPCALGRPMLGRPPVLVRPALALDGLTMTEDNKSGSVGGHIHSCCECRSLSVRISTTVPPKTLWMRGREGGLTSRSLLRQWHVERHRMEVTIMYQCFVLSFLFLVSHLFLMFVLFCSLVIFEMLFLRLLFECKIMV